LGAVLALTGIVLGHTLDARNSAARDRALGPGSDVLPLSLPEPQSRAEIEREAKAIFAHNVASLFAEIARAEGDRTDPRAEAARFLQEKLAFDEADVIDLVSEDAKPLRVPGDAARVCREELSAPERMLLLDALYAMASGRGGLSARVRSALTGLASALGLSDAEHASVAQQYTGGQASDYALLGVSPQASDEEIRRAFRRLALTHHPDKVNYLGNTAVFRASETFRAIREAYDAIRSARGF
jgi:DnaJ like chaperone protein